MTFPFIVVDQNQLQRSDSIGLLLDRCCRENLQILIPDGAGFEFSNCKDPHQTWRRCLQHLAPYPELVVVGEKLSHLCQDELASGSPCEDLVEHGATEIFREMLRQLAEGDDSTMASLIDGPVSELMPASLEVWADHDQIKANIRVIYDSLKSSLSPEFLKELRKSPEEGVRSWMSSTDGVRFVFERIQAKGVEAEIALQLAVAPSVIGGFISGIAAMTLDWLGFGGFESASPKEITNDHHDLECAILGALSASLATDDGRPKRTCDAIRFGMNARKK